MSHRTLPDPRSAGGCCAVAAACSDPPTSGGDGDGRHRGRRRGRPARVPARRPRRGRRARSRSRSGTAASAARPRTPWTHMVAGFNASQDDVVLTASDQGQSTTPRCTASSRAPPRPATDQLPDMIYLEDTQLQAMADSGLSAARAGVHGGRRLRPDPASRPAVRSKYSVDDVLYPGYMNVSTPVLYYNKAHWLQAGLDPDDPPETLRRALRGGPGAQGGRRLRQAALVQDQPGGTSRPGSPASASTS